MAEHNSATVGGYLAARLAHIGIKDYFAVPGDYNLVLLDELLGNDNLRMISCCNELNAGYAADGYARATGGAAAVVVTFTVGGLSLINAIGGAYAEDLPVIAISGGPNTNSEAEYEVLHHTFGKVDYGYQREMYRSVTAEAVIIQHPEEAPRQIDHAIATALRVRKPVYLEVACNIASARTSSPNLQSFERDPRSDESSLSAAVDHATELLTKAIKPVLVAGVKLRPSRAEAAFLALANASGYAVAGMPNAKGMFPEQHPSYMGVYWGPVGSPGCGEIVESADLGIFVGATFTDYTTTGHASLVNPEKMIQVHPNCVVVARQSYNDVAMQHFLSALANTIERNDASLVAFSRVAEQRRVPRRGLDDAVLTTRQLFARIQGVIDGESAVIAETGDSWFNGIALELPEGSRFEIQMQYGSIGWSVGATLGYCAGAPNRRVIALIGDGSFQVTAQEISTMIRYGLRPIIFLINNGGYTIEVEIHDGPYNAIQNWDYAELVNVFNGPDGNGWSCRVATEGELDTAIAKAVKHDGLALIEVMIDRDDCSKNLLAWGAHVARNNGRPPRHR